MDTSLANGSVSHALSRRESEILHLVAWGYPNKQIAARLGLSAKTIDTYKTRGLEKLGIASRVELVRHALQHEWFGVDPEEPSNESDGLGTEDRHRGRAMPVLNGVATGGETGH